MSYLIKTQIVCLVVILPLFSIFLRKGLIKRAFHSIGLDLPEDDFAPLKTILVGVIIVLMIILFRNIWLLSI
jgi:hypothetical protein